MIDESKLNAKVGELLSSLYAKRFAAIDSLQLEALLKKNPYLYRSLGAVKPDDFIDNALSARLSSSDETIFGNDFFEPLAAFAAQHSSSPTLAGATVVVGAGAGQDIAIETAHAYLAISVKSGTNIFNSQSEKGQSIEFQQLQARLRKLGKMFRPVIGYGYGRRAAPKKEQVVERLAGQAFWQLLTDEPDFYLRIARAMEPFAKDHAVEFEKRFVAKRNAMLREFMLDFVTPFGVIDWDKVVSHNSSTVRPRRTKHIASMS